MGVYWLKTAGILPPLIIPEFVKDPEALVRTLRQNVKHLALTLYQEELTFLSNRANSLILNRNEFSGTTIDLPQRSGELVDSEPERILGNHRTDRTRARLRRNFSSFSWRWLKSRTTRAKPCRFPVPSLRAIVMALAQNRDPSFRACQPSFPK